MPTPHPIVIGTRKSPLALWQTEHVKALMEAAHPGLALEIRHIVTSGDKSQAAGIPLPQIGGKGLFTAELEEALLKEEIDLAVHSLKDLPTAGEPAFGLGAILQRAPVWDALICRASAYMEGAYMVAASLESLPRGATIGSSSSRRSAQLLRLRPDLRIQPIRGNVDTRIAKLKDATLGYDAIVLAEAGLTRLGRHGEISQRLGPEIMLPAPGQGALAVQCRTKDSRILQLLQALEHAPTRAEVTAERSFLAGLGGGCNTPVGALAKAANGRLTLQARCLSPDGRECIEISGEAAQGDAEELGRAKAREALDRGYAKLAACA
jgi:hydroxymethylbilane synthase